MSTPIPRIHNLSITTYPERRVALGTRCRVQPGVPGGPSPDPDLYPVSVPSQVQGRTLCSPCPYFHFCPNPQFSRNAGPAVIRQTVAGWSHGMSGYLNKKRATWRVQGEHKVCPYGLAGRVQPSPFAHRHPPFDTVRNKELAISSWRCPHGQ